MKNFFEKNWQHFVVFAVFIIIMLAYFAPQFNDYRLKQHDVEQYIGMAKETNSFREKSGEEPLWTNSMFGGMPTIQISTVYNGNVFQKTLQWFTGFAGVPSGIFLLHLIGFYLLALCLRVRPIVGFIGAVAFAFASYEIVILQAGHNSKAMTVALMAPVVGAFIYAYRNSWKWGALLASLFMAFELASNHLQVTYYLAYLLGGLGVYEFVIAIKSKEIKKFAITSGAIIGGFILAIFINFGNVALTNDYAKHTIRGGNDVTINPDGTVAKATTAGLDKDYITNWSYGVDESFTLISPYVKGSASVSLADSRFRELIENSDRSGEEIKSIMEAPYGIYWGDQPGTSGTVYIGVVMAFLMVLGMFYLKDGTKWVFLAVSILALALSWGKNFMGLTDFFIDHIPGYNKFRTVTIILVIVELCVPIVVVMLLERLYREREAIKETSKKFLMISGGFLLVLLALKVIGLGDNYQSKEELKRLDELPVQIEAQLRDVDPQMIAQNYQVDITNPQQRQQFIDAQVDNAEKQHEAMKGARKDIFDSSVNRSILFSILAIGLMALYFYTSLATPIIFAGIAGLVMIDLIPVDQNYLNSETNDRGAYRYWLPRAETEYPLSAEKADLQILEMESLNPAVRAAIAKGERDGEKEAERLGYTGSDKRRVVDAYKFSALNFATNYRVFDLNGGWSSSRASYYHKSMGGYHGAKLRNIQNVFDFHLARTNNKVLDMLNVKYFIQGEALNPNPNALGNCWFVTSVIEKAAPNDEIRALGNEFKLENVGTGKFFVNGQETKESTIYGAEKIQYLVEGRDTMSVPLTNGINEGDEILFVSDANGVTNLIPMITDKNDSLNSFTKLMKIKLIDEFKPAQEAVMLSEVAAKLKSKKFSGQGSIKMTSYSPNNMKYTADCKGNQLAVFSEIYYPEGWTAFVDGKEVEILKTDYLLRGLELSAGKHTIEFKFALPKYTASNNYAIIGSLLLFLLFGAAIFFDVKKKKNPEATNF
jgi:hypothetical protein